MNPEPNIRVNVDPTNPGQFFACCGLLELADRLWPGAEGWFEEGSFCMTCAGDLQTLIRALAKTELMQVDLEDDTSSPILLGREFQHLRLDWWQDTVAGGKELKVWAGTMESCRIAQALQKTLRDSKYETIELFDHGEIVYDLSDDTKKVEPYYFDARRCPNAHSRDVGFAANDLSLTTTAHAAVELLCLIGLQRVIPNKQEHRIYDYSTWNSPQSITSTPALVIGVANVWRTYRFENWYRTSQKKHKAFRSATLVSSLGS